MALAVSGISGLTNCLSSLLAVSSVAAGFLAIFSLSCLFLAIAHRRSIVVHAGRAFHRVMASIITTAVPPDPKKEEFTFPNKDGSTFGASIMSFKVSQLKELCRTLGQACSGSKVVLQDRLKAYSGNPESWKLIQPGARRSHKGSRSNEGGSSDKKPKKRSNYAKRRDDLFGAGETSGPAQRSKDTRTPQEKQDVLDWASEMVEEFADFKTPRQMENVAPLFPTPASREKKIEAKLDAILALCTTSGPTQQVPPFHSLSSMFPSLPPLDEPRNSTSVCGMVGLQSPMPMQLPLSISGSPRLLTSTLPPLCPTQMSLPLRSSASIPPPLPPQMPMSAPPALPLPAVPASAPGALKVIDLANGTHIEFFPSDVPDPVLVSFSDDIPKLVRMWDDADPAYNVDECYLKIKGHGIPIRLWEAAYKYGGDQRWKGTKDKWGKWKFVVEAYKTLGDTEFWAKYCDSKTNNHMSFTAIAAELRSERKAHDAQVATEVRSALGHKFNDTFRYRGKILVKPSAIAKRNRVLQSQD